MKFLLLLVALYCVFGQGFGYRKYSTEELEEVLDYLENDAGSQNSRRFHDNDIDDDNDLLNSLEDEYEDNEDEDDDDDDVSNHKDNGGILKFEDDGDSKLETAHANIEPIGREDDEDLPKKKKDAPAIVKVAETTTQSPTEPTEVRPKTTVALSRTTKRNVRRSTRKPRPTRLSRERLLSIVRDFSRRLKPRPYIPRLRRLRYRLRRQCTIRCYYVRGIFGRRKKCKCFTPKEWYLRQG